MHIHAYAVAERRRLRAIHTQAQGILYIVCSSNWLPPETRLLPLVQRHCFLKSTWDLKQNSALRCVLFSSSATALPLLHFIPWPWDDDEAAPPPQRRAITIIIIMICWCSVSHAQAAAAEAGGRAEEWEREKHRRFLMVLPPGEFSDYGEGIKIKWERRPKKEK
jgi:hypothetical protein